MAEDKKIGCLASLLGILILVIAIYIPIYFIFMNDEIDALQEVSLIGMMRAPIAATLKGNRNEGKLLNMIDERFDKLTKGVATRTGINLGVPFEDAISKNSNISNIDWEYGETTKYDDATVIQVTMSCQIQGLGKVVV